MSDTPLTVDAIAAEVVRQLAASRIWPQLLTAAQAAEYLGYSPRHFAEIAAFPTFPRRVSVPGHKPRYRLADLRKWVESRPAARRAAETVGE